MKNRIFDILKTDKPYETLLKLFNDGELESILPELYELHKTTEEGHKNNFYHTLGVLRNVCNFNNDFRMKIIAVFHDIGKPDTKRKISKGWTFHNHEVVSAQMTMNIFDRWNINDEELRDYVFKMIRFHGRVKMHRDVTESAIRRLDKSVGKDIIFDLIDFCKCDITTRFDDKRSRIVSSLNKIKERIIEVRKKDEDAKWRSPITGYVIMDMLGNNIDGKIIGDIKRVIDPKLKRGDMTEQEAKDYINKNYKKP